MNTSDLDEQPIDPLTDTGKLYLLMRRAIKDAKEEEYKRFDPIRFVRNVCNYIVSEIDARMK